VGVNSETNRIYVTNTARYGDSLTVIDGMTNSVIANVEVGNFPFGVGINEKTNKIYVANLSSDKVSVIDGETDSVISTVGVGENPYMVGVNSITNKIYVTNFDDDNVSVIDGETDSVITVITVGNQPYGVGVNPQTSRIYVTNRWDGCVSVIDGATNSIVYSILDLNLGIEGICVNPEINHIYVANASNNNISVINGETNSMIASIDVGDRPIRIATNPKTNMVYVSCYYDGTIWVLHDGGSGVEGSILNSQNLSLNIDPNPFSNITQFVLNLPADSRGEDAKFLIYNVSGRLVKTFSLVSNHYNPVTFTWDGISDSGGLLSSGLYFGVLKYGEDEIQKKIIMIK